MMKGNITMKKQEEEEENTIEMKPQITIIIQDLVMKEEAIEGDEGAEEIVVVFTIKGVAEVRTQGMANIPLCPNNIIIKIGKKGREMQKEDQIIGISELCVIICILF